MLGSRRGGTVFATVTPSAPVLTPHCRISNMISLRTAVTATPGVTANSATWRPHRRAAPAWDANYNLTTFNATLGGLNDTILIPGAEITLSAVISGVGSFEMIKCINVIGNVARLRHLGNPHS